MEWWKRDVNDLYTIFTLNNSRDTIQLLSESAAGFLPRSWYCRMFDRNTKMMDTLGWEALHCNTRLMIGILLVFMSMSVQDHESLIARCFT